MPTEDNRRLRKSPYRRVKTVIPAMRICPLKSIFRVRNLKPAAMKLLIRAFLATHLALLCSCSNPTPRHQQDSYGDRWRYDVLEKLDKSLPSDVF